MADKLQFVRNWGIKRKAKKKKWTKQRESGENVELNITKANGLKSMISSLFTGVSLLMPAHSQYLREKVIERESCPELATFRPCGKMYFLCLLYLYLEAVWSRRSMQTTSSTGPDLRTHKSFAESSSQSKTINDKIYDCSKRRKKNKRREKKVFYFSVKRVRLHGLR